MTNKPPIVTSKIDTPVFVNFGEEISYKLPSSEDPEGLHYTTTIENGPSFVSMSS